MNINEKGVAPHGCAHTAEQKRGAQEHLHVFHKIPPSVFLVFHVDFIFFFFFSTILPSRHGMGIMGLQMRFFLHVALWQRMHMACASRSWFFFFAMYRRAAEV